MSDEMKKAFAEMNTAFTEFKQTHQTELAEIKKGMSDPLTAEKLSKIESDLSAAGTKHDDAMKRITAMELRANRPNNGGTAETDEVVEAKAAHTDAFNAFVKNPEDHDVLRSLKTAEKAAIEKKAVTIGSASAGGHAVPEEVSRMINEKILDISPIRQQCRAVTVGTSDYKELVDVLGDGYGWVGEGDTRNGTGTPSLEEVAPTFGTIYAYPQASEESLNDIFFDVSAWLQRRAVNSFAKGEGIAFISGNGTNKPTGFLDGTPEATADDGVSPARPFGTLEYVPTGAAAGFGSLSTNSPEFYPADVFKQTAYTLKAGYRANAVWMMAKNTLSTVRRFKDSEGNYIWQPGMQAGQPATIEGYNLVEAEDMPAIGANAFPVAFGDFQEGYLIADLVGMRITVDDNVTTPGQVKYYLRKRVGGILLNDDAIKLIKCAAS